MTSGHCRPWEPRTCCRLGGPFRHRRALTLAGSGKKRTSIRCTCSRRHGGRLNPPPPSLVWGKDQRLGWCSCPGRWEAALNLPRLWLPGQTVPHSVCALQSPGPGSDPAGLPPEPCAPTHGSTHRSGGHTGSRAGGGKGHRLKQFARQGRSTHKRPPRGRGSRKGWRELADCSGSRASVVTPCSAPSSGPAWSLSGHVWRWMSWEPQDTVNLCHGGLGCGLQPRPSQGWGQQGACMVILPRLLPPGLELEHPSPQRQTQALTRAETHSGQG